MLLLFFSIMAVKTPKYFLLRLLFIPEIKEAVESPGIKFNYLLITTSLQSIHPRSDDEALISSPDLATDPTG